MAQAKKFPADLSSSSEDTTDSDSDASSADSNRRAEPVNSGKKAAPTAFVVGSARPEAAPTPKPTGLKAAVNSEVVQPTKRSRAGNEDADEPENKKKKGGDADKGAEYVEPKKKKGGAVEKTVEEPETRRRKAGKAENGVDKALPQKQPSKKERKAAAEKAEKDEQAKEGSVHKEKPKVQVAVKEPVVAEKRAGKGKKQSREAEPVQNEESPKSSPPLKPEVAGDSTPVKPKNASHWSFEDEMAFSQEVLTHLKPGQQVTSGKGDVWFLQLIKDAEGKLGGRFTKDQLSDKLRRMKDRYNQLEERIKDPNSSRKFKNPNEEKLYNTCWKKIWGPTPVEPEKPPSKASDAEEDTEEDTEDEATEEPPPSVGSKQPPPVAEQSSDESEGKEDDGEEEEDNDSDQENGDASNHVSAQKLPKVLKLQDIEDQAVPTLPRDDKTAADTEATLQDGDREVSKADDAMDVDPGREDGKKQEDLSAVSEDIRSSNIAFLAKLESKLENKLLAVEQVQEKALSILEDVKLQQSRLVSLLEMFGTRLAVPVLGGLGGSIHGLLGGSGTGLTSNGVHGGEYSKLQQQWRDLDMDELGCIVRRIQLVQEQRKLQDEALRNSEKANI